MAAGRGLQIVGLAIGLAGLYLAARPRRVRVIRDEEEHEARVQELEDAGCHPELVDLEDGTTVVLKDPDCPI